ncbi:MAG: RNA pseudouridine synthase, partial [Sulfitobacter sp.]
MSHRRITFILGETPPPRLDKALARDVPEDANLSRTRIMKLIDQGVVFVNGEVQRDPRAVVGEGAKIDIDVEEAQESHILPEDIPLEIIYEDDDLVVINKPAGMVVHPAPGS